MKDEIVEIDESIEEDERYKGEIGFDEEIDLNSTLHIKDE